MAPGFLGAAGAAAVNLVITSPDTSVEAMGARYPELVRKYKEKYGEGPIQAFHQNAYDGMAVALMAIEKVAVKDAVGNTYIGRRALRDALFATKSFEGMGGEISCNEYGDLRELQVCRLPVCRLRPIELRDRARTRSRFIRSRFEVHGAVTW